MRRQSCTRAKCIAVLRGCACPQLITTQVKSSGVRVIYFDVLICRVITATARVRQNFRYNRLH
jgi:hypothetical protein